MGGLGKGVPPSGAPGSASSWEAYLALEAPRLGREQDSRIGPSDASQPALDAEGPAAHRSAAGWLRGRAALHLPARRGVQPAAMAGLLAAALSCISLLYLSLSGTLSCHQGGTRRLALPR